MTMHTIIITEDLFATSAEWEYFLHMLGIEVNPRSIAHVLIDSILNEHIEIKFRSYETK